MPATPYDPETHTVLIALDLQRDVVDRIDALTDRMDDHLHAHEEEQREAAVRRARLHRRLRWAAAAAGGLLPFIAALAGAKV